MYQAEYTILLSKNAFERIGDYAAHLRDGGKSGEYLRKSLKGIAIEALDAPALLSALLNSKKPQIFAESAVMGDDRFDLRQWSAPKSSCASHAFHRPLSVHARSIIAK